MKNHSKKIQANKIQESQIINVQAYKHDGTLYRQWNGVKVLSVDENNVVLFLYKTKVKELKKQKWTVREPVIWKMPIYKWYNTAALIREEGTHYYTNLASPFLFEDNTLKFIDYDLDIKDYPGMKLKLVDKKEYKDNQKRWKYPGEILNNINATVDVVMMQCKKKESFFNKKTIKQHIKKLVENKDLPKKYMKF